MYNRVWSLDRFHKGLADLEVARQAVERLSSIGKISLQRVHFGIVERRDIDIEDLVAMRQQLVDNVAACHARSACEDYPFLGV
jgi:recombinational DNA repair protein RecR